MSSQRVGVLELAVLGLLHETPMHGYELRKRLNSVLGSVPRVRLRLALPVPEGQLTRPGSDHRGRDPRGRRSPPGRPSIEDRLPADRGGQGAPAGPAHRRPDRPPGRTTASGCTSPSSARPRADVRLRILEGRRSRLEERLEAFRAGLARTRERVDSYTLELQRHGLESVEREVRWLNELIASERRADAESARQHWSNTQDDTD